MADTYDVSGLFDFLERDLAEPLVVPRQRTPDALQLAVELATAEWSEEEAAIELARRVTDRSRLLRAQGQIVTALARNPVLDLRGIRAGRIVGRAIDVQRAS